ncbi:MAG: hypothetical protein WD645_03425 [Dehalococcoidia bacterium]
MAKEFNGSQSQRAMLYMTSMGRACGLMGISPKEFYYILAMEEGVDQRGWIYGPSWRPWCHDSQDAMEGAYRDGYHPDAAAVLFNRPVIEMRRRWEWDWPERPGWEEKLPAQVTWFDLSRI